MYFRRYPLLLLPMRCVTCYWWLVRVTLVVAFGFSPEILGGGRGSVNGALIFYECSLSGVDIQKLWGQL